MAEKETKLPIKKETGSLASHAGFLQGHPFEHLRRQIDRLFEEFPSRKGIVDFEPFQRMVGANLATPAVDFVEKDKEYEITAELPGMDDKNVDIKLSNGMLTITGEKNEAKEEKKEGYYFSERRYGSFNRGFRVPEGVDAEKIEASFEKGVLMVRLPKTAEAQKAQRTIDIKSK